MTENETSGQETDEPTDDELAAKRARFEAFEFRVPTAGRVRVENTSYGDASDVHVYIVEVAEHVGATACTCKSDEFRATACKHRRAVEAAEPVMLAATEGLSGAFPERDRDGGGGRESSVETHPIAADGGQVSDAADGEHEKYPNKNVPAILPDGVTETHDPIALRDAGYDPTEFGHDDRADEDGHCDRCGIELNNPDNDAGGSVGHCAAYNALCVGCILSHGPDDCDHEEPNESNDDDDTSRERPTRSEPADFGGGEESGMDEL